MAKNFRTGIDLLKNQILNIVIHRGTAFPSGPEDGQFFYRSDLKVLYYYNATAWKPLATDDGDNIQEIVAGAGLSGGGIDGVITLDVNVDGATLEINADSIRIKDGGVSTAKLADGAVTTIKITDKHITFAKIQDVPTMTVLGRTDGGAGAVSAITILDEDDMVSNSATALATQQSIRAFIEAKIASLGTLIGSFDAATETTFPTPVGTSKGDYWYVTGAGTVQGVVLNVGDVLIANVDNPSATNPANWIFIESNRGQATTTVLGMVMLATGAEVIAGTNNEKAITPAALVARTATETRTGLIEIATDAEVTAGTDDERAITPLKLKTHLNVLTGSYWATVGDGSTLQFVLTHGLNSTHVLVQLKEVATGNLIEADVQITSAATVTVGFTVAPTTNEIEVNIKK